MRCLKNGVQIPKKILNHKWDELIDHTVLINKMKPGRLLGFKSNGRVVFKVNNNEFIMDINDINSLSKHL